MTHIQWKGKGILILLYGSLPFIVLHILAALFNSNFFEKEFPEGTFELVTGLALIISGWWTYKNSDDFYTDENGEEQYIYFDHKFMYLDMKIWAYIFWVIGGLACLGGTFEIIENLNKQP